MRRFQTIARQRFEAKNPNFEVGNSEIPKKDTIEEFKTWKTRKRHKCKL